jgi:hypothetical protein
MRDENLDFRLRLANVFRRSSQITAALPGIHHCTRKAHSTYAECTENVLRRHALMDSRKGILNKASTASSRQSPCMVLARRLALAERHQCPHTGPQVASLFSKISRCQFSSRLTELASQPFLFKMMVARPIQRVACRRSAAVLDEASTCHCASRPYFPSPGLS